MTIRPIQTRPVISLLAVLAGCGEPAATATSAMASNRSGTSKVETMTTIEIDAGTRHWTAQIGASPSAQDFLSQLPLDLTLEDYAATEKVATLPRKLTRDGAPAAVTPRAGDFAYYAPWGNLALFYKDGHHSPGLIILGRFDTPVSGLATPGAINVTIRRVDADRRSAQAPRR